MKKEIIECRTIKFLFDEAVIIHPFTKYIGKDNDIVVATDTILPLQLRIKFRVEEYYFDDAGVYRQRQKLYCELR